MTRQGRGPLFGKAGRASVPAGPVEPASVLTSLGTALYTWNLATDALAWGPNAAAVLGVPHMSLFPDGAAFEAAVEPHEGVSRADAVAAADVGDVDSDLGDGVPYRARYALRTRADRLVMVEDTGRWFADAQGRPSLARGSIRIDRSAGGEGLSGTLKARAALLAQIADDVAEAQRSRHAVTLVVGTLDSAEPEAAMARLARNLRSLMRRRDRLIAYGPDRFALALASCGADEAAGALERLLAVAAGEGDRLCLRVGAASAPDHAFDAPSLLRRAEEALAAATGRYALYAPPPPGEPGDRAGTSAYDLVDALNGRQLLAAHRPVRDARSREPALATIVPRIGREGAAARAGDIGAAAEGAGLSLLVDARLLELAADHLAVHLLQRLILPIAPSTLHDGEWLNTLAAHLGARPGIESRLVVAVPEAALTDPAARGRLNAMKALGVGIMVAGFGAGHLDARHLRLLPIDLVRIDGALVRNLGRSTEDRLLVHRLVDLAHHLGLGTAAEWVDDEAGAHCLAEWGVDYIEGPLCGAAAVPARQTERRQALAG